MKIIATNKKAYHDYFVISTFEAGLVLVGAEVKSIRAGFVNLKDSFISISKNDEFFVKNLYIKNYDKICYDKVDEKRDRRGEPFSGPSSASSSKHDLEQIPSSLWPLSPAGP